MKYLSLLGSTGSIGTQTLDVISKNGGIEVVAMSCGRNIKLFEEQIRKFHPRLVSVERGEDAEILRKNLSDIEKPEICYGMDGLIAVATCEDAEIVLTAIVGMLGIRPTIAAINAKKTIALANKETLVCAGHIIMPLAKKMNVKILPVDSEHSAIFQCLTGEAGNEIYKIHLTASGGPFRGKKREELKAVTAEQALKHPNWSMGAKVTIDSSTLVNKGLEVIEASWLFDVDIDNINVVIHPQSIIHSMVEFTDGSVKAQIGTPDMRTPIRYALYYPERVTTPDERIDFFERNRLDFEKPDNDTFPGIALACKAAGRGGNMPTAFNAANELAVKKFLSGDIVYLQIYELIEKAMHEIKYMESPDVDDILATEKAVYELIWK